MVNTITALKKLYVALGGTAKDVENISLIADMISAIADLEMSTFTLSNIYQAVVTVTRNGVALENGATLHKDDVLTITCTQSTATLFVNGEPFVSGSTLTVNNNVTIFVV